MAFGGSAVVRRVYLFTHPEQVSEQRLEQDMLPQLPQWRRELALKFKFLLGRVQCAEAFLLLKEGLRTDYGIDGELTFDYMPEGKPVLRHYPQIHFNLSHCRTGVMCVVDDRGEVGCDIEDVCRKFNNPLLQRCFNSRERETIARAADSEAAFSSLWTQKEAVAKLTGKGLEMESLPSLLEPSSYPQSVFPYHLETLVDVEAGFCYSVASVER